MAVQVSPEVEALSDQLVAWRRHLHRHPELSFEETETTRYITEQLEGLGLEVSHPTDTGAVADIDSGEPGPTVAIRADIDALPIQERNDHDFTSTNDGVMHACGHDGHTAILLGVARRMVEQQQTLPGRVRLLFQPAEERSPGGAKPLIEAGTLEGVDFVIGLHLRSPMPAGQAGVSPGPRMAQADHFELTVHGEGGHGSRPHTAKDALLTAAQVVCDLQTIVSRRVDPQKTAVVSVGTFESGDAFNVIADTAEVTGTVRTFDAAVQDLIKEEMVRIIDGRCRAAGVDYDYEYVDGYPPLVNDAEVADLMQGVVADVLGEEGAVEQPRLTGGEDFAYYLQERPGAYMFLGARNEGNGITAEHHNAHFDIDEEALAYGVEILSQTAEELAAS